MSVLRTIPAREALDVEFKSDQARLPDAELVEAVVCLANTAGGVIYLGVEDDGRITGLHRSRTSPDGLPALIANRTSPPVDVQVVELSAEGHRVVRISVPRAMQIVSTSDGTMKRRRLDLHGRPECVPLLPSDITSRLSSLGVLDRSAESVPGAVMTDLDPVERARLRQFIERFHGDRELLDLSDDELDGALGLVTPGSASRVPTLTGLLLIGKEESLRHLVPTHEIAFQVLEGEEVRFNEFRRGPLLRLVDWLDAQFAARNPEAEIQVGLFRVGVPRVDARAYREAVANAVVHRDYARLGAIHVRLDAEELSVSSPGGFVEGVSVDNVLTTAPRPRNPRLADAFKRLGLVERTGRGVDLIFRTTIRFGRPAPSYARSTTESVSLHIPAAGADLAFLRMVLDAERDRGGSLPVDSLIALSCIRSERRVSAERVAQAIQKDRAAAGKTLEALVEAGLVEPSGNTRARTYLLSAKVYAVEGQRAGYTRQAGFDRIRQMQMVLEFARQHGVVKRADVIELCRLTGDQASKLLRDLAAKGRLRKDRERRWATYSIPKGEA